VVTANMVSITLDWVADCQHEFLASLPVVASVAVCVNACAVPFLAAHGLRHHKCVRRHSGFSPVSLCDLNIGLRIAASLD
jgi:hypothetical protein